MPRRALIIGINYTGTTAELQGCVNDVEAVKDMLVSYYAFNPGDITTMVDTDQGSRKPTGRNIKAAISQMVKEAHEGDELFIHFSGHGTQVPTDDASELDGLDEAICPVDMNIIADNDLRLLLKPLSHKNVKLTFVADCCHSGTLLDHEEVAITGPKEGGPPPPPINVQAIQQMLASLGGMGVAKKSRSLPYVDLCEALSRIAGDGTTVARDNLHATLVSLFGDDASVVSIVSQGLKMLKGQLDAHLPSAVQFVRGNLEGGQKNVTNIQETIQREGWQQFVTGNLQGGLKNTKNFMGMLASHVQQHGPAAVQAAQANVGGAVQGAVQALQAQLAGLMKTANSEDESQPVGGDTGAAGASGASAGQDDGSAVLAAFASPELNEPLDADVGVLLTGCQDKETSADARPHNGAAYGAFTNAMVAVVRQHHKQKPGYPLTYRNLVIGVREMLGKAGFPQSPCLECSARWADTPFITN